MKRALYILCAIFLIVSCEKQGEEKKLSKNNISVSKEAEQTFFVSKSVLMKHANGYVLKVNNSTDLKSIAISKSEVKEVSKYRYGIVITAERSGEGYKTFYSPVLKNGNTDKSIRIEFAKPCPIYCSKSNSEE